MYVLLMHMPESWLHCDWRRDHYLATIWMAGYRIGTVASVAGDCYYFAIANTNQVSRSYESGRIIACSDIVGIGRACGHAHDRRGHSFGRRG